MRFLSLSLSLSPSFQFFLFFFNFILFLFFFFRSVSLSVRRSVCQNMSPGFVPGQRFPFLLPFIRRSSLINQRILLPASFACLPWVNTDTLLTELPPTSHFFFLVSPVAGRPWGGVRPFFPMATLSETNSSPTKENLETLVDWENTCQGTDQPILIGWWVGGFVYLLLYYYFKSREIIFKAVFVTELKVCVSIVLASIRRWDCVT